MRELISLGLSEKEALVYLASLESGPLTAQDLSRRSNVNRATTYVMIETLAARGMMSTFMKGKRRFFVAESPERLLSILRLQRKEIEEKEEELKSLLPRLQALHNTGTEKPVIRYMEGEQAVEFIRTESEKGEAEGAESIEIVPIDDVDKFFDHKDQLKHYKVLESTGKKIKTLVVSENPEHVLLEHFHGDVRILPYNKFPIHAEITVKKEVTNFLVYKTSLLAVQLKSEKIADAMRAIFELAWESASKHEIKKQ